MSGPIGAGASVKLSPPQRRMLEIVRFQGWVRPEAANDRRTAAALADRGLLVAPDSEATSRVYEATDEGRRAAV